MRSATADAAASAGSGFRFEEHRVQIRKVLQLQPRNFLTDEMFYRLQGGQFLPIHQRKSVPDILSAASAPDSMHIIFWMLRHIVIDHVTHPGDVEPARRNIGRHHDLVFAALETFQRFNPFPLRAIGMQNSHGMLCMF